MVKLFQLIGVGVKLEIFFLEWWKPKLVEMAEWIQLDGSSPTKKQCPDV